MPRVTRVDGLTYYAANDQEPNDDVNSLGHLLGVFANLAIDGYLMQKFPSDRQIEDCSDPDGSKESNKCCLVEMLDLANALVHCKDDGHPSNYQDQNPQED